MAVTASFTADKSVLESESEAVQFTDTSTGSPDSWIWDFGDGNFAYDQNPLHTFNGVDGDQFLVKLTAYVDGGSGEISTSTSKQTRDATNTSSNEQAYNDWLGSGWTTNTPNVTAFMANKAGSGATYLGSRKSLSVTMPSITSTTIGMYAEYQRTDSDIILNRSISQQHGSFYFAISGGPTLNTISGIGEIDVWGQGASLINYAGQSIVVLVYPNHAVIDPLHPTGQKGYIAYSRLYHYKADNSDNFDSISQSLRINIPNVTIDFVGTPLIGDSPLAVQFTDLSVVSHALSIWDFGDGNTVTYAGETNPLNTYTADSCSLDLL